jgi:hypothetical protein
VERIRRDEALKGIFAGFKTYSWLHQIRAFEFHPVVDIDMTVSGVPYVNLQLDVQCVDVSRLGYPMMLLMELRSLTYENEIAKVVARTDWWPMTPRRIVKSEHKLFTDDVPIHVLWMLIHEAGGKMDSPHNYYNG